MHAVHTFYTDPASDSEEAKERYYSDTFQVIIVIRSIMTLMPFSAKEHGPLTVPMILRSVLKSIEKNCFSVTCYNLVLGFFGDRFYDFVSNI